MDFISNNNKAMIWGLLQDSNIFEGIENEKYNLIQKTFEDTISEIHKNNNGVPLLEKNKMAMNELIININKNKNKITSRNENPLEMIYTATDLQNHRTNELTIKLKEQQDSMNLLMNPEKPQDVNFSDTSLGDDKPIGDEMDRLIAERMSSRERELELPPVTKEAEKWLNTNANNNNNNNNNNNSIPLDKPIDGPVSLSSSTTQSQLIDNKKVSFHENILDNNRQTMENKQNTTTSIFSKLKRKQKYYHHR